MNAAELPRLSLPLDDGNRSLSMPLSYSTLPVSLRYDAGHNQQAIANPSFTYSPLALAVAPDVGLEQDL